MGGAGVREARGIRLAVASGAAEADVQVAVSSRPCVCVPLCPATSRQLRLCQQGLPCPALGSPLALPRPACPALPPP